MNSEVEELKEQVENLKGSLIEAKEQNQKLSEELDKSKPSWSGTWEMDLLTKQVSWSNEMYLILGLDSSTKPDMAHLKNKLDLSCQDKLNGALNKTFHSKKDYSFEHFINVADNKLAARTDLKPILDEDQNLIKLVGKLTDISQTKSDQKELEKLSIIASHTSNAVVMLTLLPKLFG